jgi:hypothetical protein
MNLADKVTFAIIGAESTWRTDLTIRFTEYFSKRINGESFIRNIIYPLSVDEALEECKTDFLIVQTPGHIIFDDAFFLELEAFMEKEHDIVMGHVELFQDYLKLDTRCIVFNMRLWAEAGCPLFESKVREGPSFRISRQGAYKFFPEEIEIVSDSPTDKVFVPNGCSTLGAEILIRQMRLYGKIRSLRNLTEDSYFYLDKSSPYAEIHFESIFERRHLGKARNRIFAVDSDDLSHVKNIQADLIIAPAQGLKALNLVEYFGAAHVVIYDVNPLALELQRMIFSTESASTYGEIVREFLKKNPEANIIDDWESDEYAVVPAANKALKVEYRLVDAFTYEIEELLKELDSSVAAVVDFSDIYVYPFNFYRKPLYQVQGLFAEVYSLLRSREGPTHVLGFAPGFQSLDKIEINTSTVQFNAELMEKYEKRADLERELVKRKELDDDKAAILNALRNELTDPVLFKPDTSPSPPHVDEIPKSWTPPERVEINTKSPLFIANELGYTRGRGQDNVVIFTKEQWFEDFTALYEYTFNEVTGEWHFKVSKVDGEVKVEFSNGVDAEGLIRHMRIDKKINPKTALMYL